MLLQMWHLAPAAAVGAPVAPPPASSAAAAAPAAFYAPVAATVHILHIGNVSIIICISNGDF